MNFSVAFFCFVTALSSSSESRSMVWVGGGLFLRRGMVSYGAAAARRDLTVWLSGFVHRVLYDGAAAAT